MSDRSRVLFAVEKLDDCLAEGMALLREHWAEIAMYQDLQILDPQYEKYREAEQKNALIICTARDAGDRALIGYHVTFVIPMLHYKTVIGALDDIHYIRPDYRQGWTGVKLIKFAERMARERGAHLSIARAKAKSQHAALYARLGYDLSDEVFLKRLDKPDGH
jgi:GNAT superfamily N-acetyltransferase